MIPYVHSQKDLSIKFSSFWPSSAAYLRILKVIVPGSCLTSSRYTASEGGVDPSASPCHGHRHGGKQIGWWGECNVAANLPVGLQQQGGGSSTWTTVSSLWISKKSPFHISHLVTRTSKQKTLQGTNIVNQIWCLIRALHAHKKGFHGAPITRRYCEILKKGRPILICHPGGSHKGVLLGIHLDD